MLSSPSRSSLSIDRVRVSTCIRRISMKAKAIRAARHRTVTIQPVGVKRPKMAVSESPVCWKNSMKTGICVTKTSSESSRIIRMSTMRSVTTVPMPREKLQPS